MRSKYLVIVLDLDNNAAGIVFWRLLKAMSEYVDCELVSPSEVPNHVSGIVVNKYYKYRGLPCRIEQQLYKWQGFYIADKIWAITTYHKLKNIIQKQFYDGILSFVYGGNYAALELGSKLSSLLNIPWIIYSVDAIPIPVEWTADLKLRNRLYHYLNEKILKADAFFSSNPSMMRYEKNTFCAFKGFWGVVLTTCKEEILHNKQSKLHSIITFLYAGYLYGPRKAESLIKGFEKFYNSNPKSKMVFVGDPNKSHFIGFEHLIEKGVIEIHPFTKEIESFYQSADVLIDINADIENDVFLSSKVINYLSYDKPIIAISQDGSPVREIMSGYRTIIHSHHNVDEIYEALIQGSCCIGENMDERAELFKMFDPNNVAKQFVNDIVFSMTHKSEY